MSEAKLPARRIAFTGMLAFGTFLTLSNPAFAADVKDAGARADQPVTFAKDVAPILQERRQECHQKGSMAPMSLVTYEETPPCAKAIRQRVITPHITPCHIAN